MWNGYFVTDENYSNQGFITYYTEQGGSTWGLLLTWYKLDYDMDK